MTMPLKLALQLRKLKSYILDIKPFLIDKISKKMTQKRKKYTISKQMWGNIQPPDNQRNQSK